jgi:hypothetical protein
MPLIHSTNNNKLLFKKEMKRSGFKNKIQKPMKRSGFKKKNINIIPFLDRHIPLFEKTFLKKIGKLGFVGKLYGIKVYSGPQKRSTFKKKAYKPLKRTKLSTVGHSPTSELKRKIQAILRQIVVLRDGGCIMRHYKNEISLEYQDCGGFSSLGKLVLQAEHLHTRSSARAFSDTRLIICLCKRHHGNYKPEHTGEYYAIVRKHIGKQISDLLTEVQNDTKPYKVDLNKELLRLRQELKEYESK